MKRRWALRVTSGIKVGLIREVAREKGRRCWVELDSHQSTTPTRRFLLHPTKGYRSERI